MRKCGQEEEQGNGQQLVVMECGVMGSQLFSSGSDPGRSVVGYEETQEMTSKSAVLEQVRGVGSRGHAEGLC